MALYQSGSGLSALVGVGTTNPTSNLQVYGTPIAAGNVFSVLNTAASGNVAQFSSSTGTALIINYIGNVGIGLTNPTANLQVVGNVLSGNVISSVAMYGVLAGSNTVSASVVTASSMVGTFYGQVVGSNVISASTIQINSNTVIDNVRNISCAAITSSGGTLKTSYSQGTNQPDFGQAYFYNPTNAASQDASCGVRLAGSSARNCYFSMDVYGTAGYSMGISGTSQNLVFKATWDFSSTTLFTMDRSGNFTATASVAANSDRRIKTDLQVIPNALEKVKKISGYTFKRTDADLPRQAGVIAQELLEVLPEVVHKNDDGIYSVSYGNIVALLIEALKEESAKREELEKRLNYSSIVVNCTESVIHI